jgi:hypothetical protein
MAAGASGVGMRPIAWACARLMVEPTDTTQSITPASAPAACSPDRIAAHTPASYQARDSP